MEKTGKSDKELTVELVKSFLEAWSANPNRSAIQVGNLQDMVQGIYKTIRSLED